MATRPSRPAVRAGHGRGPGGGIVAVMTPEIRTLTDDDLYPWIDSLSTAFLERPDIPKVLEEAREFWDLSRVWGAFDGRVVGTFRSWGTQLTVPGGAQVPASAVAAVTVLPSHRRRGILSAMVAADHAAARDRGEAVAILHASEYPIYGRFGYGAACRVATWTVDTHATGFAGDQVSGVELVPIDEAARDTVRGVFDAHRARRHGEIWRRDVRWDAELGLREAVWGTTWKGFLALHRDASGAADGYVRYHAEEKWEEHQPRAILTVDELHALTDAAYAALWRFCLETDLVARVRAGGRTVSESLPWRLTNARAAVLSEVGDGLWVRLLDVPGALEARRYERAGTVVLELHDREAPGGRMRVALDATPDGATCRPTGAAADLALDVQALGAAYLGGAPLADAARSRGVDELRAGALAEADALLRTAVEPWCTTFF